jgi:hypothetical protein
LYADEAEAVQDLPFILVGKVILHDVVVLTSGLGVLVDEKIGVPPVVDFPMAGSAKQDALVQLLADGLEGGHPIRDREVLLLRVHMVEVEGGGALGVAAKLALASLVGHRLGSDVPTTLRGSLPPCPPNVRFCMHHPKTVEKRIPKTWPR